MVYIPRQYLERTELIKKGSRINYITYFQFHPDIDTSNVFREASKTAESSGYDVDTIEDRKEETGSAFRDLSSFLELIAFTALLLGCLGVASSIYVYVKGKVREVAVMRCLGMKAKQAIFIYLIQVSAFGLIGSLIGCTLGVSIHMLLPEIVKEFIPVTINPTIYWPAIFAGIVIGVVISILFGLLSLVGLRNVSPLSAIRLGFESVRFKLDLLVLGISGLVILFIFLALWWQLQDAFDALIYSGILIGSVALLFAMGKGLSWLMKRLLPSQFPFVWRQGMSNRLFSGWRQHVLFAVVVSFALTSFIASAGQRELETAGRPATSGATS